MIAHPTGRSQAQAVGSAGPCRRIRYKLQIDVCEQQVDGCHSETRFAEEKSCLPIYIIRSL